MYVYAQKLGPSWDGHSIPGYSDINMAVASSTTGLAFAGPLFTVSSVGVVIMWVRSWIKIIMCMFRMHASSK